MISKFFNNQVRLIQGTPIDMRYSAAVLAYVFLTVGMYYYIIVKKISLLESSIISLRRSNVATTDLQLEILKLKKKLDILMKKINNCKQFKE